MAVGTNIRSGRASALLIAKQSAYRTYASDFTAAGNSAVLWCPEAGLDLGDAKNRPSWMTHTAGGERSTSRYSAEVGPSDSIDVHATPQSVEYFLRSNWGPFAAGAFTLKNQVFEWFTLGWLEDASRTIERFARVRDAFLHDLTLLVDSVGFCWMRAQYHGTTSDDYAIGALGGITLPAAPVGPGSKQIFEGRTAVLRRDPAGANEIVPFDTLSIRFSQGVRQAWDMMALGWDIFKGGNESVEIAFSSRVSDQAWTVLAKAIEGTKQRYSLTVSASGAPAKTLTINLYEVDFEVSPLGRSGQASRKFDATGQAHMDGSGNFVSIGLA